MKLEKLIAAVSAAAILVTSVGVSTWAADVGSVGIDASGNLAINADNFPDATFRDYIIKEFDDGDEVLSQEERESVTRIVVANYDGTPIESLAGIEYFTNLTVLDCNNNPISELDVSKNTELVELQCNFNAITSLDVSNNTKLTELSADGNLYVIEPSEDNTFDLSTLPEGFDIDKTSNWSDNCSVNGTTLTITGGTSVTYDYDVGNGQTVTFTLAWAMPPIYGGTWKAPIDEIAAVEIVDETSWSWTELAILNGTALREAHPGRNIRIYFTGNPSTDAWLTVRGNLASDGTWDDGRSNTIGKIWTDYYNADGNYVTVPYSLWSKYSEIQVGMQYCTVYGMCFEDDADTIAEIEALIEEELAEYKYTLNDDGTLTITEYKGSDANLVIPSTIDGKQVTVIGEHAFLGNSAITNVTIPEGVTTIMYGAFRACHSLSSVTLPSTLSLMTGEGYYFHDCPKLTSITFKNGNVTIDGDFWIGIYEDGTQLKHVPWFTVYGPANSKLQSYVEKWYYTVFDGQYRSFLYASTDTVYAGSIDVPATDDAFTGKHIAQEGVWYNLAIIDGKSSAVTAHKDKDMLIYLAVKSKEYAYFKIGGNVGGEWDTENTVENEVVELTDYYDADLGCIKIPYSVWGKFDEIYVQGGYGCTFYGICFEDDADTIAEIEALMEDNKYKYTLNEDDTLTITEYNGSDVNVVIPSTIDGKKVTVIGNKAFHNNTAITSVNIPEGVTTIMSQAFDNCKSLSSVTIPEGVTTIMSLAFDGCQSLSSITLPSTLTLMGGGSVLDGYFFDDCPKLTSITFKNGNVTISGDYPFGNYYEEQMCQVIPWFTVYGPANSKLQSYVESMYTKPVGEDYRSFLYASTDTVYAGSIDVPATDDAFTGKHIAQEGVWYNLAIIDGKSSAVTAHKDKDMLIYLTVESNEYAYFKIGGNVGEEWDTENTVENEVVELTDYYDADLGCITIPYSVWGGYDEIYVQGGYGCTFYGICFGDDADTIAEIKALMGTEEPEETTTTTETPDEPEETTTTTETPDEPEETTTTTKAPEESEETTTTTKAPDEPEETTTTTKAPEEPEETTTTTEAPVTTTATEATTVPEETTISDDTTVPSVEVDASDKSSDEIASVVEDIVAQGEVINIVIAMNDEALKDAGVIIGAIKDTDSSLTLEGEGYEWLINGDSVTADIPNNLDMSVKFDAGYIPEDKVEEKLADLNDDPSKVCQISLAHDGEFGFEGTLSFDVDRELVGKKAVVYYFNEETEMFEVWAVTEVYGNGKVKIHFKHASEYLMIVVDELPDEAEQFLEEQTENEGDITDSSNPATGAGLTVTAVFAAAMGITAVFASKKNKK